jgi:endonuclease/exonuclease/phosphatase (EEP) superfamily protein YafD
VIKKLFQILKILLLIIFLFLLFVHFIIKDNFRAVNVLFYACPLPLLIIFGLFVTSLFIKSKRLFYSLSIILLAMIIYFFTHYFGSVSNTLSSKPSSHILFWNVAENQPLPTDILIEHIHQFNPSIVALVEAFEVSDKDLNILKISCPEYHFQTLRGEMLIAVKGSVDSIVFKSNVDVYRYNCMVVTIDGTPISLMIADVYAYPFQNKEKALNSVKEAALKYEVDILVGDFNTPYESVFFNDYKSIFNSFHPHSVGMTSTWPTPFPLIEIDQIWMNKTYLPIQLKKFQYSASDHKLLVAEYR